MRELGSLASSLFSASAGAERVLEILGERPRVADRPDARPLRVEGGAIALRGVSYQYLGAKAPALRDASLDVHPGEILGVTGPSGAGKSTIARLLLRFDDPQAGSIEVDGQDLRDVTLDSLRDQVTVLLQEDHLFDVTAHEAIAYGKPGATAAEVQAAARAAGIHEVLAALPEGYDTRLGQRGRTLSGGQRRRLAIARAPVRDTPVLVLDEPTTGLDAAARERLLGPLRTLMTGRTVVLVSHDPDVLSVADRIVELHDGHPAPIRVAAAA